MTARCVHEVRSVFERKTSTTVGSMAYVGTLGLEPKTSGLGAAVLNPLVARTTPRLSALRVARRSISPS